MDAMSSVPKASAWSTWIADSERRLCEVYQLSPQRLIAEYRHEREITRGYHGREILELLQNAGDAARLAGTPGRVRIVVKPCGVAMGNTGRAFDQEGLQSLQTANLSPKRTRSRESAVIGDKGLGFRSILNWTHSPMISSGALRVAYLPSYAKQVVLELESQCDDVARWVAKEREITDDIIVPRLAFPEWIENWETHPWPADEAIRQVALTCQRLREAKFDTAVGMPFANGLAFKNVVDQLDELTPEFLLLVDSIDSVAIEIEGRSEKFWSCKKSGTRRSIIEGTREIGAWTVRSFSGEVPSELLDHNREAKTCFNLTVAIPESGQDLPGKFFCYFPCETELPLPLLAHATVELDETRKHINDTRPNRYILGKLAKRIAELAEIRSKQSNSDPWVGCRMVTPDGYGGAELSRLGFYDCLKEVAKSKKLVPVLSGGHRTANEVKWVPGEESKWWPWRHFKEITAFNKKEDRKLAEKLDVGRLSLVEIVQRLVAANDLTIKERAFAIAGLLHSNDRLTGDELATLLCDESGTPLSPGSTAIFQPAGELPKIPEWATIRFLHPDLRKRLGRLLDTNEGRELQHKLRQFGVVEYSLVALIRPVLAEANRRLKEIPEKESQIRTEVLNFLWDLFQRIGSTSPFSAEIFPKLLNQAGQWTPPNQLYFGAGYGREGNVSQDLYGTWAPQKLIVKPEALGLAQSTDSLFPFLEWLGLERWPRIESLEQVPSEFIAEVKDQLRYPIEFGDTKFDSPQSLSGAWIDEVETLDGLTQILIHAPPEAVLAWMALDARSLHWMQPSGHFGKLKIRPFRAHRDRSFDGALPSYIHWLISSTRWLPTTHKSLMAPRHCLIGDRQMEALFPQPSQPGPKLDDLYGVSERVGECYLRTGVLPGLAHLGREDFYKLLLEAPNLSPDGIASRALSRWFLLNESTLFGFPGAYQKRFFREGLLWGAKDNQPGYFKISELRHVDFDGLPGALIRNLWIADLPKRVGAQKVKSILGVSPLERSAVEQTLISHRKSPSHEKWKQWFEEAKPAIKLLRQTQTKQNQAVGTLERLELTLCDELKVEMKYEGAAHEHTALEGEWFLFSDILYVRGDLDDSIDLLADATGVSVASIFGIADGDAFSRVLRCDAKSREKLLRRMCGDEFQSQIDSGKVAVSPTFSGQIVTPIEHKAEYHPADESFLPGVEKPPVDEVDRTKEKQAPKTPGITQLPHEPLPPLIPRKLVVRNVKRKIGTHGNLREIVSGERCEEMAAAFEEQCEPPRFALGVGHIIGSEAPGFDLVSFDSAADRDSFSSPVSRDWQKVKRFIEVKGRSSSTAKIELKGNELRAARLYGDRYFLYRFYEDAESQFFVSILKNPMAADEALSQVIEIDLERANTTLRFEFIAVSE